MKYIKRLILLLALSFIAYTSIHKYYVSITKIEYVKEKQSVQIITRIFIDDLERLLKERYDEKITLASNGDEKEIDNYIKKYLLSKLKITIDEKETEVVFIGKEYDEDVVQCYLEIENVERINSFSITNKILFDIFNDQKNIVRTSINKRNKSFILIPENDKGMLNF
ncbi:DUF6702 family protein [uncultured Lacinutrix sp.]|uniref:DUF6702 family protein n=1 Tax=uncultured Lacinutrix sp. TaxID=574032 RepID=UPI00261B01D2|nr:DUF6702 family protein [uncultured Lacinutrix sp.]